MSGTHPPESASTPSRAHAPRRSAPSRRVLRRRSRPPYKTLGRPPKWRHPASQPCAARSYGTESREKWRHPASQPCAARSYGTRPRSAAWGTGAEGPRRAVPAVGTPRSAALWIAATAESLPADAQPPGWELGEQTLNQFTQGVRLFTEFHIKTSERQALWHCDLD
jgi:hypothetical protein